MTVHILVLIYFCISGFFVFFNKEPTRQRNALYMKLTFPVLFLVHSLRAETVGWDTDNYVKAFRYYLDF